jgi:maleylacetoacetate isomerase
MSTPIRLHTYFRSSASFRVRIALNLKGLAYEPVIQNLPKGEHLGEPYRALAGFGLVPLLEIDGLRLQQSMAIIEYLEARQPNPALLPADEAGKARARALSLAVACEIHPLNNLRVLKHLKNAMGQTQAQIDAWYRHWCDTGLAPLEADLAAQADGAFAMGAAPSMVDCFLVPQLFNARRYEVDLSRYPRLLAIEAACLRLNAFQHAQPSAQPDAA